MNEFSILQKKSLLQRSLLSFTTSTSQNTKCLLVPAVDSCISDAESVSLVEGRAAERAREAVHVEHEVARAHHQLRRRDRRVAARAPLRAVQSEGKRKKKLENSFNKNKNKLFSHFR